MNIRSYKILVTGLVQGIGFRPFIAELAEKLNLSGYVKNLGGVVEILIYGDDRTIERFIWQLKELGETNELPGCRIDSLLVEEQSSMLIDTRSVISFEIVESDRSREEKRYLPVDLPVCDRCIEEMHDPSNRRYRYPFISCTACGPRFSIQKKVPYDRETITMDDFEMCGICHKEYTQKGNIRRHAQTIACRDCGPKLRYVFLNHENGEYEEIHGDEECLCYAVDALRQGKIGAVKDIGGYHFVILPTNAQAATRLREFKHRDKKPFAVMFPDVEHIREYCNVSETEETLLLSPSRPIVLLEKQKDFIPEICGESDRIGAFLPCNPLQVLLLEALGPLVMTSGNRGGEPIIICEEEMRQHLHTKGIDFMLTHDREILTPLDDSIYQVTVCDGEAHPQLIRRARGLVPEPITLKRRLKQDLLATGGDLKATFALGRDELVYMSQYFGDLDDVRCMESRHEGLERMVRLLEINPDTAVSDLHPGYRSVMEAAQKYGQRLHQVQHHHAHIASVIAEHGLDGMILGIACDGTGYGTDGSIWGSEFLLCKEEKMQRAGHFSAVKLLGGDTGAKQADMTLFSYMMEAGERGFEVPDFVGCELQEMAWKQNINTAYSSSMGRLFDAAASLLDICHENTYEGLCAIKLEQAAHLGKEMCDSRQIQADHVLKAEYGIVDGVWQVDSVNLLMDLYHLKEKYSAEMLAYLFHHAIAGAIVELTECIVAEYPDIECVALSGGCFINRILLNKVMSGIQKRGIRVFINRQVPCGDGGIALGQSWLASF